MAERGGRYVLMKGVCMLEPEQKKNKKGGEKAVWRTCLYRRQDEFDGQEENRS